MRTSSIAVVVWVVGLAAMVTACESKDVAGSGAAGSRCAPDAPCTSVGTECRAGQCVTVDAGTRSESGATGADAGVPDTDAGSTPDAASAGDGAASGDAASPWPIDPPPEDTPAPLRTDDCDFGAHGGDIVELAAAGPNLSSLVVDRGYVYFGSQSSGCLFSICTTSYSLRRIPRCGGPVEDVTSDGSYAVVGGGMVYWTNGADLVRYHESDKTTEIVDTGASGCIDGIAANETSVVVYDRCRRAIVAGRHADAALVVGVDGLSVPSAGVQLALGSSNVYFTDGEGVAWWSLTSGARGRALATSGPIKGLSVADPGLLVGEVGANLATTLTAVPWQGAPMALGAMTTWTSPVIDDGAGYWIGDGYTPARVRLDGSWAIDTVLPRTPQALDVYGGRLYWAESRSVSSPYYLLTGEPESAPTGSAPPAVPPLWDKRYGGAPDESFSAAALDSSGDVYVLGTTSGTTDLGNGTLTVTGASAPLIAKLSPDGTPLWSQVVDVSPSAPETPRCLAVNGGGLAALTLDSGDSTSPNVPEVRQLAASGATTWTRTGTSGTLWPACAVTDAGDVVVATDADTRWPNASALDAIDLLELDQSGATKQETLLGALDTGETFATSQLVAVPGGGIALSGQLVGSIDLGDGVRDAQGVPATLVVRLAADGTLVWSRLLRGGESSRVQVDASGGTVVAVQATHFIDPGGGKQWVPRPLDPFTFVITFAADGTISGSSMIDGAAVDLALGADGGVYLSGFMPLRITKAAPPDVLMDKQWVVKLDGKGAFVSAWPTPWLEYGGPWIAVGGGRLVVAGSMGRRNASVGFTDTQGEVTAFAAP